MKSYWLIAVLLVAASGTESLAQGIRGVTRKSVTSPGVGVYFSPMVTNSPANAPAAPAVAIPPRQTVVVTRTPRVPENKAEVDKRVLEFQRKRAEDGWPTAQFDLAKRYLTGNGVPKDFNLARKWLELSAENGHQQAVRLLAELQKATSR